MQNILFFGATLVVGAGALQVSSVRADIKKLDPLGNVRGQKYRIH